MKRTVKSASDLKRLALATGASLEHSGGKFNTTMDRAAATKPEPKEEPKPAPVVVPPAHQDSFVINLDMEPLASAIDAGNERICESITKTLKEIQVPGQVEQTGKAQPCSWVFTVNRDTRGFIQSVEAKPKL